MKSQEAINKIMSQVTDEYVITSTGMISREVFKARDRERNFYLMGSMGASLGVGIGLALNTKNNVIVIAGDGDILMHLGTLVLMNHLKLKNLKLHIIDNNCYASTGCQKTCSNAVDFKAIADCEVHKVEPVKGNAERITLTPKQITKRFLKAK